MTARARLERLEQRRSDPNIQLKEAREVYKYLTESESVKYVLGAMQAIDAAYTEKSWDEADRVQNQLEAGYPAASIRAQFDHQGSVTNDTHIKAHSDIDLLSVEKRFHYAKPAESPYQGDAIADLRAMRRAAIAILKKAFPAATVVETGSKSVPVEGGSLSRKVDVVVCAWFKSPEYKTTGDRRWVGIEVFDNDAGTVLLNLPFLHNARIEEADAACGGGLRKLIRLLKTIKADSDGAVTMSSYDIAGLIYNMPVSERTVSPDADLLLLNNCRTFLRRLRTADGELASISVPNGTRKVFCAEGATLAQLDELLREVEDLATEIEVGLATRVRKLSEARVAYQTKGTARRLRQTPVY